MKTYWSTVPNDGIVRYYVHHSETGTRRLSRNDAEAIGLDRFHMNRHTESDESKLITNMRVYHVTNTVKPLELRGGALTYPTYFYQQRPGLSARYEMCNMYQRPNSDPHFCRMFEYEISSAERPLKLLHLTVYNRNEWGLEVFHMIFGILISISDKCPHIQRLLPLLQDYDAFLIKVTVGGRAGLLDRVATNVARLFGDDVDNSCKVLTGKSLYNFLKTSVANEFQQMGYDGLYEEYDESNPYVVLFEPSKYTRFIGTFSNSKYYYQMMTLFTFIGRRMLPHQQVTLSEFKKLYKQWKETMKNQESSIPWMFSFTDFMVYLKRDLVDRVYYGADFAACDGIFKDAHQFYLNKHI